MAKVWTRTGCNGRAQVWTGTGVDGNGVKRVHSAAKPAVARVALSDARHACLHCTDNALPQHCASTPLCSHNTLAILLWNLVPRGQPSSQPNSQSPTNQPTDQPTNQPTIGLTAGGTHRLTY
eukprot:350811-Chlamydomonas_euryale.AAC.2